MVGRTKSLLVKKNRRILAQDHNVGLAASRYKATHADASVQGPRKKQKGYSYFAQSFGVAKKTVRRRQKEGESMIERGARERATKPEEDEQIVLWIMGSYTHI